MPFFLRGQIMKSLTLTKAVILSFSMVAASMATGYVSAQANADRRSDSIPSRPTHKSITKNNAKEDKMMSSMKDMMEHCRMMHEKMHQNMMERDRSPSASLEQSSS
tara:strand:+ start:142 stop:459 length:318 start_codon:yes stop_codon:yes gene_type:complete